MPMTRRISADPSARIARPDSEDRADIAPGTHNSRDRPSIGAIFLGITLLASSALALLIAIVMTSSGEGYVMPILLAVGSFSMGFAGWNYATTSDAERAAMRQKARTAAGWVDKSDFQPRLDRACTYSVTRVRQSGYKEDAGIMSGNEAIRAAKAAFARSRHPEIKVLADTEDELVIERGFHDHRGRQEGKKITRIVIRRVS